MNELEEEAENHSPGPWRLNSFGGQAGSPKHPVAPRPLGVQLRPSPTHPLGSSSVSEPAGPRRAVLHGK